MAPLLVFVLVGWVAFSVAGAVIAQAKQRPWALGVAIGFASGLLGLVLGVVGLAAGIGALLLFAVTPAGRTST